MTCNFYNHTNINSVISCVFSSSVHHTVTTKLNMGENNRIIMTYNNVLLSYSFKDAVPTEWLCRIDWIEDRGKPQKSRKDSRFNR